MASSAGASVGTAARIWIGMMIPPLMILCLGYTFLRKLSRPAVIFRPTKKTTPDVGFRRGLFSMGYARIKPSGGLYAVLP
jgi:hypothetical protein